jgi:sugar lactone lactonase YvrE
LEAADVSFRVQLILSTIVFMLIAPVLVILAAVAPAQPEAPRSCFVISGFSSDCCIVVDAATGDLVRTLTANLDGPLGMAIAPNGRELLVCSELAGCVERYDLKTWERLGTLIPKGSGGLEKPSSIVVAPDGESLLVADFESSRVLQFDAATGAFQRMVVESQSAGLHGPDVGMALTNEGDLLVPSFWNHGLISFGLDGVSAANGAVIATKEQGLMNPRAVLPFDDGSFLISNEAGATVLRFDSDFELVGEFIADDPETEINETGGLRTPSGMAIGPYGDLYITDVERHCVLRYDLETGKHVDTFVEPGTGGLQAPTFIAFIPAR